MSANAYAPVQLPLGASKAERDFYAFHADHPHVYAELVKLARRAKRRGARKLGIKMLWEVMRWNLFIQTSTEDWKLNNNFPAYFARLIMKRELDLVGMFDLRRARADEHG